MGSVGRGRGGGGRKDPSPALTRSVAKTRYGSGGVSRAGGLGRDEVDEHARERARRMAARAGVDEDSDDASSGGEAFDEDESSSEEEGGEDAAGSLEEASTGDSESEGEGHDDDSEEEEEEQDDEDEEEDDEDSEGDETRELEKKAKAFAEAHRMLPDEFMDGSDGEEGEDDDGGRRDEAGTWGKRKEAFYSADIDDHEIESDEEAKRMEEEEALRLERKQRKAMKLADFGVDEETLEAMARRGRVGKAAGQGRADVEDEDREGEEDADLLASDGDAEVEAVERDLSGLSEKQREQIVAAAAPELPVLLEDLRAGSREVAEIVQPLKAMLAEGSMRTDKGMAYLDVKHMLLLNYCANLVFYLLLKAEGQPSKGHPVLQRLVEIRVWLEKMRPIDKKLQNHIEKLLRSEGLDEPDLPAIAQGSDGSEEESGSESGGGSDGGVYEAPRRIRTTDTLADPDRELRDAALDRERSRRERRSALIREIEREVEGRPEKEDTLGGGFHDAMRERDEMREVARARQEYEETHFVRLNMTKEEKKDAKRRRRTSGLAELVDLGDDLVAAGRMARMDEPAKRKGMSAEDAEWLERKRKLAAVNSLSGGQEAAAKKKRSKDKAANGGDRMFGRSEDSGSDDPEAEAFYAREAAAAAEKKRKRAEHYDNTWTPNVPGREGDELEDGSKRGATKSIIKNKGLRPHRKKEVQNPRKKYRNQFEDKEKRRRGAVREVRDGASGAAYGGELTGIKSNITKGRRL